MEKRFDDENTKHAEQRLTKNRYREVIEAGEKGELVQD